MFTPGDTWSNTCGPCRFNCAFTGADGVFYEPSKATMKKVAHYYGVGTAPWAFVYEVDMEDDDKALAQVRVVNQGCESKAMKEEAQSCGVGTALCDLDMKNDERALAWAVAGHGCDFKAAMKKAAC